METQKNRLTLLISIKMDKTMLTYFPTEREVIAIKIVKLIYKLIII
ncbi:hypothetical protein BTEBP_80114 [Brochothrix thermosphacta]|nr:hypothetical protein BTEBP_80114 [Brochothrix thermosphacta]